MELKEGMYVRTFTLSGFSRIGKLEKIDDICITDNGAVDKTQIIKASYNIIDLIEVGDYVNGLRVYGITDFGLEVYMFGDAHEILEKNEIKSIVTKEQFESMSYRVGE